MRAARAAPDSSAQPLRSTGEIHRKAGAAGRAQRSGYGIQFSTGYFIFHFVTVHSRILLLFAALHKPYKTDPPVQVLAKSMEAPLNPFWQMSARSMVKHWAVKPP